jgi:osmoprotectant transport system substrate-binding protein
VRGRVRAGLRVVARVTPMNGVRRILLAATVLPLLVGAAACGADDSSSEPQQETVTLVGQKFTEADILTQLYKQLLDKDGYRTRVKDYRARERYLGPLEKGSVQVAVDYLSAFTDELNRSINGAGATPVGSPDLDDTLAQLATLGAEHGLTPLRPARAEHGQGYAVTKAFAEKAHLATLSDLGRLGRPVALAADTDCAQRPDCGLGLKDVYGIQLSKVEPLGLGSGDTVRALTSGRVQLAQVGTTDGTLDRQGLVILRDDKSWQNAENVVPVVNTRWLEDNPKVRGELEKLSAVLTTADLVALNAQVASGAVSPSKAAAAYLQEKGLI